MLVKCQVKCEIFLIPARTDRVSLGNLLPQSHMNVKCSWAYLVLSVDFRYWTVNSVNFNV